MPGTGRGDPDIAGNGVPVDEEAKIGSHRVGADYRVQATLADAQMGSRDPGHGLGFRRRHLPIHGSGVAALGKRLCGHLQATTRPLHFRESIDHLVASIGNANEDRHRAGFEPFAGPPGFEPMKDLPVRRGMVLESGECVGDPWAGAEDERFAVKGAFGRLNAITAFGGVPARHAASGGDRGPQTLCLPKLNFDASLWHHIARLGLVIAFLVPFKTESREA